MIRPTLLGLATCSLMWSSWMCAEAAEAPASAPRPPNIIFILADDLALGDVGCYGQQLIQTPHLDRMAAEGMRCTQAYSGTSVCSPSRSSLMTGLHLGHCPIRGNREMKPEGQMPLPPGTVTVASVLASAGYATACTGKWGMGMFDTSGSPLKNGFSHFFGYNCQRQAHSYFPKYLYDDDRRTPIEGRVYAQDLLQHDALTWITINKDRPFFLFYAATLPHIKLEIDDLGVYADREWNERQKTYAAMVSRLDHDTGEIIDLLKSLHLDENTLIIFAGDNGSSFAPDSDIGTLFNQGQGMRGYKRSMYEGGLRQAALIRWPGTVPAGTTSDAVWAFWDFLPTVAELVHAQLPDGFHSDGISLVPMLNGGELAPRECLYWELHEGEFRQAVRFNDWKAVRNGAGSPLELYDLKSDPGETHDLSRAEPVIVKRAEALLITCRTDDANFPIK
jgi:arylsulfatase A